MTNTLITYIRDKKGVPHGVAVATRVGDEILYGYSLHNPEDKWNKKTGLKVALARANAKEYHLPNNSKPYQQVMNSYLRLEHRALRYFKDLPQEHVLLMNGNAGSR